MKVLVVGGAGYIGSLMCRRLSDTGHQPVVLDDLSTGNKKALHGDIPFYEGDLGDQLLLKSIFNKETIELVMHFAAKIQVGESVEKPDLYYENNVAKVLRLLNSMLENNVKRFIFSSTAAVYGQPEYLPIDEDHPINPINPYGASKRMVEIILQDYEHAFGLNSIVLRYFNAAGASLDGATGESQKVKQNLIPIVLDNLEKGKTSQIFGTDWDTEDGTCIRDYIHIEDIVAAHLKALEHLSKNEGFDIFNLGTNNGASVKQIIDLVSQISEKDVKSVAAPRRPGDPGKLVASSQKAHDILGWQPCHSDHETIMRSAYNWHFNRQY